MLARVVSPPGFLEVVESPFNVFSPALVVLPLAALSLAFLVSAARSLAFLLSPALVVLFLAAPSVLFLVSAVCHAASSLSGYLAQRLPMFPLSPHVPRDSRDYCGYGDS
jgi:hypothetical protein